MSRSLLRLGIVFALASISFAQSGREQILQAPFESGVSHVDGKYGFTQDNYLIEGANRISSFGSNAIFVYMEPTFRSRYPDKANAPSWPAGNPQSLAELAQTAPYKAMFDLPFKTFVITAYSFATMDGIQNFSTNPDLAALEEQEFYDLTKYLYTAYAGTGKTFILKHWEGDYAALQGLPTTSNISPAMIDAMNIWLSARQRGISRARNDSGNPSGVGVFHAVEVCRVLDYSHNGLTRLINAVVPVVKPDMVSYSSYEATLAGTDATSAAATINEAINVIKSLAPDPLGLGNKRIFFSEYGLFENELLADQALWRTKTILQTAQAAGIYAAFFWTLFDNECKQSDGSYFPIDSSPGATLRPTNSQCRGLWLVRPDGSTSPLLPLVAAYWKPSTSGMALTGRVTSTAGSGIAAAVISFYGGQTTADSNGNYTLANVPAGSVQLTASAAGYQNSSVNVTVNTSQNPPVNFTLTPSTAPGSIIGLVTSAVDGRALSGVTVQFSAGSMTSDSTGAFIFTSVPGGTYAVTAKMSGWIPSTTAVTVQPGITTVLLVRLATGGRVAGRVSNGSGAPVAGATVNVHGGLVATNVKVQTDANGNYDSGWIPVGSYQVTAAATNYGTAVASVTVAVGAIGTQNFVLGPPQPDFYVTVSPSMQTVTASQSISFTGQVDALRGFATPVVLSVSGLPSGANAAFNPASLAAGSFTLKVSTSSSTPAGSYALTINGSAGSLQHSIRISLTVKATATTGAASGKVTRATDGTAIYNATVSSSFGTATTDQNGNYTLANLPVGSVQLTASATGFKSTTATANIVAGQTTAANFSLASSTPTGSINGRITSASNGAGLSGATVTYSGHSTTSDANGYYKFTSVAPGTYQVTASLTGRIPASVTVTVASSAVTANIRLATGGKITGKIVNRSGVAISGATVKMTGGQVSTTVSVLTNSSGVYISPWIPVGTYTVQASKSGYTTQSKTASVATGATTTVSFTLQ